MEHWTSNKISSTFPYWGQPNSTRSIEIRSKTRKNDPFIKIERIVHGEDFGSNAFTQDSYKWYIAFYILQELYGLKHQGLIPGLLQMDVEIMNLDFPARMWVWYVHERYVLIIKGMKEVGL